jgi:hypothetical protein
LVVLDARWRQGRVRAKVAAMSEKRRTWIDHTTDIEASAESVMAALSDIDGWARWTPGLTEVRRRPGPLAPGQKFTMLIKPASFHPPLHVRCKLYQLTPTYIEWGGDLLGSVVRHSFELTPLEGGRTRVRQHEYATGIMALLARVAEPGIHKHDLRWQNALRDKLENRKGASAHQ